MMNQILSTKSNKKISNKKKWFKFQFGFSIFVILSAVFFGISYYHDLVKKENISDNLIHNYSIYQLYRTQNQETTAIEENSNGLFGIIEIPKINIYYPVFSELSDELLKIAPCKFYGNSPRKAGNICIAGHNYHNLTFFSKLSTLTKEDEIYLFDHTGTKFIYSVYDVYEVEASNLSPVFDYIRSDKILTLFTCDDLGKNRTVVKSKQKSLSIY